MLKSITAAALAVLLLACAGCNTMAGMGKDIERAGEKVQGMVRDAR